MSHATHIQAVKVLPWGEEVYLEIPLHKKSANKFYARHGKTGEGREYIEFSKFGPKPNTENETYSQKLRLFSPLQWAQLKHYVEGELSQSVGWDIKSAEKEFVAELTGEKEPKEAKK
ncbi:MAG TPA: hypothetical protein VFH37_03100 [Candidatus Saccharimonadales bacterium]|nr:hypothetical protein [Candidatus Saccharimonadales bacterium]